jgi:hypothetical protein
MLLRSKPSRRWSLLSVLLVAGVLAAGTGAALASRRTFTPTEAVAAATAISIRQADVPKLKQRSNPMTAKETAQNAQLTACIGGVAAGEALANTQSPSFVSSSGASVTLSSGTEILPSAALVAKDLAAVKGPHGLPCILKQLRGELVGKPPKGETVTSYASRLAPVVSGADSEFVDRFTVVVTVVRKTTTLILPLYVDVVGFAYGQAEISLTVEAVGSKPSVALEHRLATLLLARARTAIG